jgi:hypothetical protein
VEKEKQVEKERGREGGGEVGETERLRWGFLGWFNFVKKNSLCCSLWSFCGC